MSRYGALGVDVEKRGIEAFRGVVENLFPDAFCAVQRDPKNPRQGLVSHVDGAGSKPIQSYLHWRETGDASWFGGLAQDVVAMNLDDIVCVAAEPLALVDYVALNPMLIDRVELLGALAEGFRGCLETLAGQGVHLPLAGGETADLPDQLRTLDVSGSIFGRVDLEEAVSGGRVAPGDVIVGLRSGGPIRYERGPNSGIMCNGLTLARSCLMRPEYVERYPEIAHPGRVRYTGRFEIDDRPDGLEMTVGEALLSPTRVFAPVVGAILARVGGAVHGMVHNTGGGLTKCLHIGRGIRYVKDSLAEPDPIFSLIQREAGVGWSEMCRVFNMGVGFELIVEPGAADEIIGVAEGFKLGAQVIGRSEASGGENALVVTTEQGRFTYP